ALGRRERAAGRVVEVGDHVRQLHRPLSQGPLDGADVEPVGLERRRDQLDSGAPQEQERAVVGGLLDDDPVARLQQVLEDERRRLHRAVRHHHVLGPDPVQLARDPLAEPRVASARPVRERPLPIRLERPRRGRANRLVGQQVRARGAAGEADHLDGHGPPSLPTPLAEIVRPIRGRDPMWTRFIAPDRPFRIRAGRTEGASFERPRLIPSMMDAAIAALAQAQDGVVATFQLRAAGITKDVLSRRVRSGQLRRLHQGVFLVGDIELTRERRWRGGVLACGLGGLLAYWSGATLWDLARDDRGLTHVIAPGGSRLNVPGVVKHRARNLHPEDRAEVNGIPVTSVARTLLDLAPLMRPARLARMLEDAERRRVLDAAAVVRVCDRNRGHRGARRLVAALRRLGPVPDIRSPLERMFAEFCPRYGIPSPSFNVVVAGYVVDAVWQRQRLVVELD